MVARGARLLTVYDRKVARVRSPVPPLAAIWRYAKLACLTGLNPAMGAGVPVGVRPSLPPL